MKYDYDNEKPFSIFVTNLGKYNEGELVGEWVGMPTTQEEFADVLDRIGINEEYEEYFITDYDNYTSLPLDGEYEDVDQLNHLAEKLESMDERDYKTTCAAVNALGYTEISEMINTAMNVEEGNITLDESITSEHDLGVYAVQTGISDEIKERYLDYEAIGESYKLNMSDEELEDFGSPTDEELGQMMVEEYGIDGLTGDVDGYIDYEALGKDIALDETAEFTDDGYVRIDSEEKLYDGIVPDEDKIIGIQDDSDEVDIENDSDYVKNDYDDDDCDVDND